MDEFMNEKVNEFTNNSIVKVISNLGIITLFVSNYNTQFTKLYFKNVEFKCCKRTGHA